MEKRRTSYFECADCSVVSISKALITRKSHNTCRKVIYLYKYLLKNHINFDWIGQFRWWPYEGYGHWTSKLRIKVLCCAGDGAFYYFFVKHMDIMLATWATMVQISNLVINFVSLFVEIWMISHTRSWLLWCNYLQIANGAILWYLFFIWFYEISFRSKMYRAPEARIRHVIGFTIEINRFLLSFKS